MIKMKDSGIPWIGQIPENWEFAKYKFFASFYNGNSIKDEEKKEFEEITNTPYISTKDIDKENSKINYNNGLYIKEKDIDFRIAHKDSCLICIEGGSAGKKIGFLTKDVAFVNKLCCVNPKMINDKFSYYILLSDYFNTNFNLLLSGLIGGVTVNQIKNINIAIPPKEIQQKIVEILDKKCGQIDELVSLEENEIEKLKEYKTSLITKVVTKGLDHNAKMKDSGIPWIGQIPESWITIKIKFTSWLKGRIGWDGLKSSEFKEDGPFLITGTDFNNGNIKWDTCAHITEERFMEDELLHVKEGDLLITKDGTIGKLAIVKNCPEKVSLNSGVMIIRNNSNWKYDNKYLYYILLSNQFYLWYEKSQNGNSTIKHLYQEQFYNFEFSYPNILYQKRIVAYLDNKCEEIDNLLKIKQEKIEKLKEYKKSLIYQYVTGKKEVV